MHCINVCAHTMLRAFTKHDSYYLTTTTIYNLRRRDSIFSLLLGLDFEQIQEGHRRQMLYLQDQICGPRCFARDFFERSS
jgi:hypothetical protein